MKTNLWNSCRVKKALKLWYDVDYDSLNILMKVYWFILVNVALWPLVFSAKRVAHRGLPTLFFLTESNYPKYVSSHSMASYEPLHQVINVYVDRVYAARRNYFSITLTRILTHEVIHHILFREFGLGCCEAFDNVAYRVKEFGV